MITEEKKISVEDRLKNIQNYHDAYIAKDKMEQKRIETEFMTLKNEILQLSDRINNLCLIADACKKNDIPFDDFLSENKTKIIFNSTFHHLLPPKSCKTDYALSVTSYNITLVLTGMEVRIYNEYNWSHLFTEYDYVDKLAIITCMKKFINNIDKFESLFYKHVDNITKDYATLTDDMDFPDYK